MTGLRPAGAVPAGSAGAACASIPAAAGIGLRFAHHQAFVDERPPVAWLEVHAENYFGGGTPLRYLDAIRRDYPVSLHGIGLSLGGSISIAFVAAIFVSNIPQGIAGTLSLEAVGTSSQGVLKMWLGLSIASALVAAVGFLIADQVPDQGFMVEAFAAGAVLTMLADSMMPESFEHGGKTVGLLTVLGFFVAATLTVLQG